MHHWPSLIWQGSLKVSLPHCTACPPEQYGERERTWAWNRALNPDSVLFSCAILNRLSNLSDLVSSSIKCKHCLFCSIVGSQDSD